jgi:hypothetical protein
MYKCINPEMILLVHLVRVRIAVNVTEGEEIRWKYTSRGDNDKCRLCNRWRADIKRDIR